MKRIQNRLTDKGLRSTKTAGYFPDGNNLYLQISASGTKSWIFRYALAGRQREMGLGAYPTFGLADARSRATDARKLLSDGIDPLEVKRESLEAARLQAASIIIFDEAAARYITMQSPSWSNAKHAAQWASTLKTYASPIIGKIPVHQIDNKMILSVLEPIWIFKRETADRVRQRIAKVLDWCKTMGYRTGDNPAELRGNLEHLLARTKAVVVHHPALPYADMGAFMLELKARPAVSALALRWLILSVTRVSETLGARKAEIDFAARVWIVPASRMKLKREHRVPLSDAMMEVLQEAGAGMRDSEFIFADAQGNQLSTGAFTALLKRMNSPIVKWIDPKQGNKPIVPHGFRSTFRDFAAEVTHTPNEVCEQALAHAIKSDVEAAYRRGDLFAKRVKLMQEWGLYCSTIPQGGAKVIPLRGAA